MLSKRKNIVQNNIALFNGLFDRLSEILDVGKILYKATDAVKLQEYTFEYLKKRVRNTFHGVSDTTSNAVPANADSTNK